MEPLRAEVLSPLSHGRKSSQSISFAARDLLKQLQTGSTLALSALLTIIFCKCAKLIKCWKTYKKIFIFIFVEFNHRWTTNAVLLSFFLKTDCFFFFDRYCQLLLLFFYIITKTAERTKVKQLEILKEEWLQCILLNFSVVEKHLEWIYFPRFNQASPAIFYFSKFSAPTIAFLAFWLAKKLRLWANSPSFTSYGK